MIPPGWQGTLRQALDRRFEHEPLPGSLEATAVGEEDGGLPFAGFFQPFLRLGAAQLRARQVMPLDGALEDALLGHLARRLKNRASRVLILELNVARMLGRLPGSTPRERFHYFSTTWFRQPEALPALLVEYPVLAQLIATTLDQWVEASCELLERLAADGAELSDTFFEGRDLGTPVAVDLGLSDPHRGGRTVARLQFSSGLGLFYKPKSLAIDGWFQRLLATLNRAGLRFPHRTLQILERDGYGWCELVEATGCDSREALRRFYWRQGSLLAVLHLLSATDFHRENLIAAGECPVLVDLEALLHHRQTLELDGSAVERALERLGESVLAIGLLPISTFAGAGLAGMDISGLGGDEAQVTPHTVPELDDLLQDTMRVVRRHVKMEPVGNRPRIGSEPANAAEYTEDLVQGFEETWRLLAGRRDVLAPLLAESAELEVRNIVRSTREYVSLLHESYHPDFLRDAQARDKVLDHLRRDTEDRPELRRTLPFEYADLLVGDVPVFTSRPGRRDLWASDGTRLPDFFARDSLGEVRERLASLDEAGCARQVSLIRQAMLFLEKEQPPARAAPPAPRRDLPPAASPEECLAAATAIGEALAAEAIRGKKDVTWIGLSLESVSPERWGLSPLWANLHDGLAGLALFFGYLAEETDRHDFGELARAAAEPVRESWRHPVPGDVAVGPFVGRSSAPYVLSHLAALWDEPDLMQEVLAGLPALEALVDADPSFDLISGSAGCSIAMLRLHRRTGDPRALAVARRCGDRLLGAAIPGPGGSLGWPSYSGGPPLSGLSHGAAGMAWALLELGATTGDGRYTEVARRALQYERTLFVPEQGNWRDLRSFVPAGPEPVCMTAWCHGAPGIALGRAMSLPYLDDPQLRDELSIAVETTLGQEPLGSHCLCHGEIGNAEVLHVAGEVLGEPRWRRAALQRAAAVLREARAGGWRCGVPKRQQTPGLMVGLAGIGLGLLRLAAPHRVPSVLALR